MSIIDAVIAEFQGQLDAWRHTFEGRPHEEMTLLWHLALEREQIVTVAYRRDIIQDRLDRMPIDDDARDAIARAIQWAWRDEEMHALYIRGVMFESDGTLEERARTFVTQTEGQIAGWISSRQNHYTWSQRPITRAVAELLEVAGVLADKVPEPAREALHYNTFADFCRFNVAAERTAGMGWERIAELAEANPELEVSAEDLAAFRSIAADEARHARVFELFAESFDANDALKPGVTTEVLLERLAAIGQRFLNIPRAGAPAWSNPLGKGATVFVRETRGPGSVSRVLRELLEELDLPTDMSGQRVAIMTAFMMITTRDDLSPGVSIPLLRALGAALASRGAEVTVLESSNIFDQYHDNRRVGDVASYLGATSPHYTVHDTDDVQTEHVYLRGLSLRSIAAPWRDADHRVLFGKLRSHPTSGAMLTLEVADGLGGRNDAYQFGDRRAERELITAMTLDAFPPDAAILDATTNVADGLMGMMGTKTPRAPRRLYASRDAVSLDIVVGRHLGAQRGELSVVDMCTDWFGDPRVRATLTVNGPDTPIANWMPPSHSARSALLQKLARPVYAHTSAKGELFLPDFDEAAFPSRRPAGAAVGWARKLVRRIVRDPDQFNGLLPTRTLHLSSKKSATAEPGAGPP